jgi:hypothetical protein
MEEQEDRIVVGLDIGTTKVCAIVASIDPQDRIHILGVGRAPSEGLNRGVVVNIDKTVNAIQTAIEQAQLASGIEVNSVNVGIAGDHIRSMRSKGVITINNRDNEITVDDVERLLEDCQQIMLPTDQEIIHVIPQEFVVDGQDGISDPVGMNGMRMEAEVHIITGLVSAAKNIYRCVERAGYQVADIILEPLASSYAVLDDDEKEAGVVLVDYLEDLYRKQYRSLPYSVIKASRFRVRPIMMTSVTTIFALVPILFQSGAGSEVMIPIAVPTVGGMVTATLANLVLTPALFFLVERFKERWYGEPEAATEENGYL